MQYKLQRTSCQSFTVYLFKSVTRKFYSGNHDTLQWCFSACLMLKATSTSSIKAIRYSPEEQRGFLANYQRQKPECFI